MFVRIISAALAVFLIIHGLIHFIGFRVYAQAAQIAEMPFKTTFLNGSFNLGVPGTRVYGWFWLLPTLGFVLAGAGFFLHASWWQPALIAACLASLVVTGLDWGNAFRGTLIDLLLLVVALLSYLAARLGLQF